MKIKYTGPKPVKKVTVGTKELTFDPCCELNPVFDIDTINWLLHKDRAGLFIVAEVEDKTPSVEHPEATKLGHTLTEAEIPVHTQELPKNKAETRQPEAIPGKKEKGKGKFKKA